MASLTTIEKPKRVRLANVRLTDEQRAMAEDNRWLAHEFVNRWYGRAHRHYDDLVSEAYQGICRAVATYDPVEFRFSTYASHWMRSFTGRYIESLTVIRVPSYLRYKPKKTRRDRPETPRQAQSRRQADAILTQGEGGLRTHNVSVMDDADSPLDQLIEREESENLRDDVDGRLSTLDDRSYSVVSRRLRGETLEAIGSDFSLSKERIRQIEKAAIKQLRKYASIGGDA